MKRYDKKGNIQTVSAKMVFDIIAKFGESEQSKFSIHDIIDEDCEKRFRVYCGDLGGFEVTKVNGDEEYSVTHNDWIWIEGVFYKYHSLSSNFNGYPNLPIEVAYDFINK